MALLASLVHRMVCKDLADSLFILVSSTAAMKTDSLREIGKKLEQSNHKTEYI